MASFETRVVTTPSQLQEISSDWAALWDRCRNPTPFERPEWMLSWVEAFSPSHIATIEVRLEGVLVGLAPWLIYRRDQERVLAFMAGGVSDYLDVLIDQRYENQVVTSIFEAATGIDGWSVLDLTDLPWTSALHRTKLGRVSLSHDSCSALRLPNTKQELLQVLSKRQRANLRNARSRLERAGGGAFEIATPDDVPEFLEDLFRLHASRWSQSGQPGVLADASIQKFHRNATRKLTDSGMFRMYRLRLEQRPVAVLCALLGRSRLCCYAQGFDPEFAFVSPGTQLMFFAMEDALQSGLRKFDFLRGEESYKQHWRAESEQTFRIQVSRSQVKGEGPVQEIAA
ncbi:MAG TPA: GNAT family N-acetyltransferase [Terriglobales bacterium]|nr:GNAT family N-acetyltransferase [Terriglobales bacterium]